MFNFFKKESFTPEQKIESKKREDYEKLAEVRANEANALKPDLTSQGIGALDKEDVIRQDAEIEDEGRGLLKTKEISQKEFEVVVDNSLVINKISDSELEIEGDIAGQKVYVKKELEKNDSDNKEDYAFRGKLEKTNENVYIKNSTPDKYVFSGEINGKKLSNEEALALFDRCYETIQERSDALNELHDKKINKHNDEKTKLENEKKIKEDKRKEALRKLLERKEKEAKKIEDSNKELANKKLEELKKDNELKEEARKKSVAPDLEKVL